MSDSWTGETSGMRPVVKVKALAAGLTYLTWCFTWNIGKSYPQVVNFLWITKTDSCMRIFYKSCSKSFTWNKSLPVKCPSIKDLCFYVSRGTFSKEELEPSMPFISRYARCMIMILCCRRCFTWNSDVGGNVRFFSSQLAAERLWNNCFTWNTSRNSLSTFC